MPGLLDNIDTLAMAQGLLGSRRPMEGLLQGMMLSDQRAQMLKQAKAAEEDRALRQQMAQIQLQQAQQQAQRQKALEALPAQFMRTGKLPDSMDARDIGQPGEALIQTQFDLPGYAQAMFRYDPQTALALQASMRKDTTPIKLGKGDTLLDPVTRQPIYTAPDQPDQPSAVREYEYARQQGYQGTFQQFQIEQRRAGATNVSVNTAKPLLNTVAEGLGKQIDASLENARAAVPAIQTAQTLKAAVDSGKIVSGPGASFRVAGLQIGQMLGIGGKDGAEVLANTRSAIQSMAQAELNAAAQMKGQGQITESERDIIRRAASGRIDDLTAPEIKQLADVMEKTARFKISQHKRNVGQLRSMQGAEALVPFYDLEEPPAYSGPPSGGVRRYNPATGRIE